MFPEICDSGLPVVEFGWRVREQVLERRNQVCGFGDVEIQHLMPALVEDGALRVLEEDVVEWVARLALVNYSLWRGRRPYPSLPNKRRGVRIRRVWCRQ